MSADQEIVLHQTVHGYRSGHELLQTSLQLAPEVQRTLLVQTDLSGPRMAAGFEEYASGYPLESVGLYVLSRTWYAREMERPGCVWTHSLLISFPDLARLTTPSRLNSLFRRPTKGEAYGQRQLPELVLSPATGAERQHGFTADVAASTLRALYGVPDRTAVVFADNSSVFESLIMAIWSQQWPRLRRSFRFCSGALAAREQDGTAFDLLVAPAALRSRLIRELPSAVVVGDDDHALPTSGWVEPGVADIYDAGTSFRDFLWAYGADAARPRESWRPLAETFELLAANAGDPAVPADRIVAVVGAFFPDSRDCGRLKSALFGRDGRYRAAGLTAPRVLLELSKTPYAEAFSDPGLQLLEQATALWTADRAGAIDLLAALVATDPLNVLGEQVLGALCDAIGPSAALELEQRHRGLLTVLIDRAPRLAASPDLWRAPVDRQREFLDVLSRKGREYVRDSIGAMLAAGAREIAGDVAAVLGSDTAGAVLDAVDKDANLLAQPLGEKWDSILTSNAHAVVDWLRRVPSSPARLGFAIVHLDPHGNAADTVSVDVWLAATSEGFAAMSPNVRTRCAGFFLALGLRTVVAAGARLVSSAYPDVYRAAFRDELPFEVWRWMSDDLPPLYWYRQWDKCQRLSLGLVNCFERIDWPIQEFLNAARDEGALQQALEAAQSSQSSLLSRLLRDLDRGSLSPTPGQRRIIDGWRW